jgi:hypothetical protein
MNCSGRVQELAYLVDSKRNVRSSHGKILKCTYQTLILGGILRAEGVTIFDAELLCARKWRVNSFALVHP